MRILVVASHNKGSFAPFIIEQAEALKALGCEVDFFGLTGKGIRGYLSNLSAMNRKIKDYRPDVVHAHYGLSGLLATLQHKVPVVVTYHGSDINDSEVRGYSKKAMRLSAWDIFVSRKTMEIAQPKKKYTLLPCGVDLLDLQSTEKCAARERMHLSLDKRYVLFSGAFDNAVKNAPLAQEAIAQMHEESVELLELKGFSREEVTLLLCAVDAFLMTSFTEGSPQVIKEALACGCPIVSVDVGDVRERTEGVEGCFVAETREPEELAQLLNKAIAFEGKTRGCDKLLADGLDNRMVVQRLMKIYASVCRK
jgi:glycosyltransferase involved in cell wall biosynthesis